MRKFVFCFVFSLFLCASAAHAGIFGQVHGVVHDPQHRPLAGARVDIRAVNSDLIRTAITGQDGSFALSSIALGDYTVTVSASGFESVQQGLTLMSETSPTLHFELQLGTVMQSVTVENSAQTANVNTVTPTTLISRQVIAQTPGADRTNSIAMITDYVPGAYMSHDMLHMRGGHQVSWLIDGSARFRTQTSPATSARRSTRKISTISRCSAAATPPTSAIAPTASST